MNDLNKDVSFLIKTRRIELHEDPRRLADFVHLSLDSYLAKENGAEPFNVEEMLILMDRLSLDLSDLAGLFAGD